jgi:hypothetical protein
VWWWILLWTLLGLGALAVHGWLLWRLVRKGLALARQLGASSGQAAQALVVPIRPYHPASSAIVDPARAGRA